MQKGHAGWRLKKVHDFWGFIDGVFAPLPILECRARDSHLLTQVAVTAKGNIPQGGIKLGKLGSNLGTRPGFLSICLAPSFFT
jgi:hypothetical protein